MRETHFIALFEVVLILKQGLSELNQLRYHFLRIKRLATFQQSPHNGSGYISSHGEAQVLHQLRVLVH